MASFVPQITTQGKYLTLISKKVNVSKKHHKSLINLKKLNFSGLGSNFS